MESFNRRDLIIIGGGPAGLAAAIAAKKANVDDILIIEREDYLGGILNQCIHDGFGLEIFGESLTGPEYAQRFIDEVERLRIPVMTRTMVTGMTRAREVSLSNRDGLRRLKARAIILAMGCRERTRGALAIPGTRPAGIYTAGCCQNLVNIRNLLVGKRIVILGSGDIGLIMARRLTLEGAKVLAVVEILPYPAGLPRNISQCLEDFGIPLLLSHTVVDIEGERRLRSVTIARIGRRGGRVAGTRKKIPCDTLILACGLIPENELSREAGTTLDGITGGPMVDEDGQTDINGIFACGNVLQVKDLVDYVTLEATRVGKAAASYIKGERIRKRFVATGFGEGIKSLLPHRISTLKDIELSIRVSEPGRDKTLSVNDRERLIEKTFYHRVNPSEMLRVRLKKELLSGISELRVSLS